MVLRTWQGQEEGTGASGQWLFMNEWGNMSIFNLSHVPAPCAYVAPSVQGHLPPNNSATPCVHMSALPEDGERVPISLTPLDL